MSAADPTGPERKRRWRERQAQLAREASDRTRAEELTSDDSSSRNAVPTLGNGTPSRDGNGTPGTVPPIPKVRHLLVFGRHFGSEAPWRVKKAP